MNIIAAIFTSPMNLSFEAELWLLLPLLAAVGLVYKTIRIDDLRRLPREVAFLMGYMSSGCWRCACGSGSSRNTGRRPPGRRLAGPTERGPPSLPPRRRLAAPVPFDGELPPPSSRKTIVADVRAEGRTNHPAAGRSGKRWPRM